MKICSGNYNLSNYKYTQKFGTSTAFEPMAGSAAVLYHLSCEDPPIGTQHFF